MDNYEFILLVMGLAFFAAAILPRYLAKFSVSLAMLYVASGLLIGGLVPGLPKLDPVAQGPLIERVTEMAVIISLMGVGLKIDRRMGWSRWQNTWRLLAITMPICIAGTALLGMSLWGLTLPVAVLLGAVLAPTDPVLASGVQVGDANEGDDSEVHFALTSEAGLNDSLAFPFVYLAITLATAGFSMGELTNWLAVEVLWKILAGVAMGAAVGRLAALLVLRYEENRAATEGFVAIALTLVAYGAGELIQGYGFLSVFIAAVIFRDFERNHESHQMLHDFSEQVEQLFMAAILILFGMAVADGLLWILSWRAVLIGLLILFLLRPLAGYLALAGSSTPPRYRAAIGWLGVRGIGSFYYLAYALNQGAFDGIEADKLWAISGFVIIASIIFHGFSADAVLRRIDD